MNADDFYKDKAWELLMSELKAIRKEQEDQRKMIEEINKKWAYVYGIAATISVISGLAWQWIMTKAKTISLL